MDAKRKENAAPPDPHAAQENEKVGAPVDEFAPEREGNARVSRSEALAVAWEGPLPPPALLEQFDQVVPGLAMQIAEQARIEADHVRRLETAALNASISDRVRRQWIACTVVFAILAVSAFALVVNAFWVAGIALSIVTGAAAVFMSGVFTGKGKTER